MFIVNKFCISKKNITHIYKGNDIYRQVFADYRPISLLPVNSKKIETAVHNQLNLYMTVNKLFNTSQYGFREKHSSKIDRWKSKLEWSHEDLSNKIIPVVGLLNRLKKTVDDNYIKNDI